MRKPFGFFNIDKPSGMTSHDVVAKIRRALKIKKVGHAGTLDPLATGVLIICVGHATRLSEYAMSSVKRYSAKVHLGVTTETYDAEGEIIRQTPVDHLTQEDVLAVLPGFTGNIEQLPPLYSAIKQDGRKLYEIARAGETVERQPRDVTIHSLTLHDWSPPEFMLDVVCSAGTYIRSLAYDIGDKLEVGAYLSGLTRTASGSFTLENAVALDTLLNDEDPLQYLLPPEVALSDMLTVHLSSEDADHITHGRPIAREDSEHELGCAYTPDGEFLAILRAADQQWRPHKVFSGDDS